jgi:hypothetical protein
MHVLLGDHTPLFKEWHFCVTLKVSWTVDGHLRFQVTSMNRLNRIEPETFSICRFGLLLGVRITLLGCSVFLFLCLYQQIRYPGGVMLTSSTQQEYKTQT